MAPPAPAPVATPAPIQVQSSSIVPGPVPTQTQTQTQARAQAPPPLHFSLGLVLAKDSILINSYHAPPKFDLVLKIIDLNNVPLTSGTAYIKWTLPTSTASEHSGQTSRSPIKEHKVSWDYMRTIPLRLTIDKNNHLTECLLHFEVIQDYNSGQSAKGERVTLGHITLNLAEYVDESEVEGEEGVVRRYLMQESKINSTAKIGITMRQIDGERNFVAPALKSAPVFGGIAGIMKGENGEGDDAGNTPQPQKSSDRSDLHDMYRCALAASWSASPLEMAADECVEDIFAGGDGWKRDPHNLHGNGNGSTNGSAGTDVHTPRITHDDMNSLLSASGGSGEDLRRHRRSPSDASLRSNMTVASTTASARGNVRDTRDARDGKEGRGHRYRKSNDTTRSGLSLISSSAPGSRSVSGASASASVPASAQDRDDDGEHGERDRDGERGRLGLRHAHGSGHASGSGHAQGSARSLGHIHGPGLGMGLGYAPTYRYPREVDEFDVREDLVAWKLPGCVS
ncbi:hypothetical protein NHQ30_007750 [Ciborinia camelliae]|nr:hypothetical protein NHQ30_007750 [Ciborinia camelliae]